MKKFFLALTLMMMTGAMMAIPVKRGMWVTVTLADGTEVRAERVGDEHGHWLRAADGTCYVMEGDAYVKADAQRCKSSVRPARQRATRPARLSMPAPPTAWGRRA